MSFKTLLYGNEDLSVRQEKCRKFAMYFFCGIATTLVNALSFIIFDKLVVAELFVDIFGIRFDLMLLINQAIAWFLSLLTAFFGNRAFVFLSKGNIIKELFSFAAVRLASFLIIEIGFFAFLVMLAEHYMGISKDEVLIVLGSGILTFNFTYLYLIKIVNSIVLIVVNYYMSKGIVFRNKKGNSNG